VSFSTVFYAPKFSSLDLPHGYPEWVPPPGFQNQRHNIGCLNAAIVAINKSSGVNYLNLHLEGIRIDSKSGKEIHELRPKKQVWREKEVRRRLHFTPDHKAKITRKAARLLQEGLSNTGEWNRLSLPNAAHSGPHAGRTGHPVDGSGRLLDVPTTPAAS